MKILTNKLKYILIALFLFALTFAFANNSSVLAGHTNCVEGFSHGTPCIQVGNPGFTIPTLSDILTFAIRLIFVIGGLAALVFLLLGAFSWITSGGDKDRVSAAMQKIQAAVLGVIMIAVVLAIVVTLEQVVFGKNICLGLSCPITIPSLIEPNYN